MTVLADIGREHVRRVLARGIDTVVTAEAVVHDIDVVEIRRRPGIRCVAIIAIVTAGDMRQMFAGCDYAVVAEGATSQYLRMVYDISGRPDDVVMTILADVSCLNMQRTLTLFVDTVVTIHAVAGNIDVIEVCGCPGKRRVAIIASGAACDVVCILAGRSGAVVASTTAAKNLCVIDLVSRVPYGGVMAVGAVISGRNMRL